MKKLLSIGIFFGVLFLTGLTVNAQTTTAKYKVEKKNGYQLEISLTITNGKIQDISLNEFRPVNQSFHECSFEASRNDGISVWTMSGNKISIASGYGDHLFVTNRKNGFVVSTDCSGVKVLFVKKGSRYVGKMLM